MTNATRKMTAQYTQTNIVQVLLICSTLITRCAKKIKCPANTWIVPILLAIYSLITCIMLLNVLIAIFKYVKATLSFYTL